MSAPRLRSGFSLRWNVDREVLLTAATAIGLSDGSKSLEAVAEVEKQLGIWMMVLIVSMDSLCHAVVLPVIPAYSEYYSHASTDFEVGMSVGAYYGALAIGQGISHSVSTKYGRRPALLLSLFGALVGYLVMCFPETIAKACGFGFYFGAPATWDPRRRARRAPTRPSCSAACCPASWAAPCTPRTLTSPT